MRVISIIVFIATLGIFAPSAHAIVLPEAGLTPESPFYFADLWDENLRIFLTLNSAKRIRLRMLAAAERLAEAYEIAGRGIVAVEHAIELYGGSLTVGLAGAAATGDAALIAETAQVVNDHMSFFDEISERTPFDQKLFVVLAKEDSIDKQGDALRTLLSIDTSSALQIYTQAVAGRFARVRKVAIDKENIREALREYEKYALLGEDIENDARSSKEIEGDNVTRVVKNAFAGHYALLENEVLKKLRPQDDDQFRNTMRAVAMLLDIPIVEPEVSPVEENMEEVENPKEKPSATSSTNPPVEEGTTPPPPPPPAF